MISSNSLELAMAFNGAVSDYSGKGTSITTVGAPGYVTAKQGSGIQLSTSGTRIEVAHASRFVPAQMTVAFWLYITTQASWQVYASKMTLGLSSFTNGWCISTCTPTINHLDQLGFYINGASIGASSTYIRTGSSTITTATWYHVAVTYDGAYARIYLNGLLMGEQAYTGGINANTNVMKLNPSESGYNSVTATYDDYRFYNRAYPEADIRRMMLGYHPLAA